jgi:hypothetical protein
MNETVDRHQPGDRPSLPTETQFAPNVSSAARHEDETLRGSYCGLLSRAELSDTSTQQALIWGILSGECEFVLPANRIASKPE